MDSENINNQAAANLVRLGESGDYKVAAHDPDIRGWIVLSADGREIGRVNELLVDIVAMKVRYLDIYLYEEITGIQENRHLLIPVGLAKLDEKKDQVTLTSVETVTLLKFPEYQGGDVSREYETNLRNSLSRESEALVKPAEDFYDHDIYDEQKFFGSRRKHLYRLSEIDNIAEFKDKDIRGYIVTDPNGNEIGRVEDIIVEPGQNRIRYLEVNVSDNLRPYNYTGNSLLPIGLAGMSDKENHICINLSRDAFLRLPTFQGAAISRDYENLLKEAIRIERSSATTQSNDYYGNEYYDDNRFYDVRRQRGMM